MRNALAAGMERHISSNLPDLSFAMQLSQHAKAFLISYLATWLIRCWKSLTSLFICKQCTSLSIFFTASRYCISEVEVSPSVLMDHKQSGLSENFSINMSERVRTSASSRPVGQLSTLQHVCAILEYTTKDVDIG